MMTEGEIMESFMKHGKEFVFYFWKILGDFDLGGEC